MTMKNRLFIIISLLVAFNNVNAQVTTFRGTVHNWLTDTVYLATLPFHSPYSSETRLFTLSSDSTFEFSFPKHNKPFAFVIGPEKHMIDAQIKKLLYDNLTSKHYYGHCIQVYTCGFTTYLIEPGQVLDVDITFQIGKSEIEFHNENNYGLEYYQTSFNLDDKCDKALEKSKTIQSGIKNLKKKEKKLLSELEGNKEKISPFLYQYLRAEIEFGARKEFLKFLRFRFESYLEGLFSKEIPKEIMDIVEFNKTNIDYATLINEEYVEYLENYINFKYSIEKGEYVIYKEFDNEKFEFAMNELPEVSKYSYLANNILHKNTNIDSKLIRMLIQKFPDGELNDQLSLILKTDYGF